MNRRLDRRQFGRRRTQVHAFLLASGRAPLACMVRNISLEGALVEVEQHVKMPPHFRLIVEADRFEADCEIRHQTVHGIGVYFHDVRIGRGGRDTRTAGIDPARLAGASGEVRI